MNDIIAITQEIEVIVDLNTIIKYHPASAAYLIGKDQKEYKTKFNLKLLVERKDEGDVIHPDYKYADIVDRTLPDPSHEMNLLALVKNMIEMEWGYYQTYYIEGDDETPSRNLHMEVIQHLKELKILVGMMENSSGSNIVGKLNQTELKKAGDKDRSYNVDGMQVEFSNEAEVKQVIELLANNRIKELTKPEYHYYNFYHEDFTAYTTVQIQEAIDRMALPFRDYRAKWLFCKHVSKTVLQYLKGEMEWNQGNVDVTENQGVFIHTLLTLFNLIGIEQELKNITARDKAKHIRSFFRSDLKDNDEEFIRITKVKDCTDFKFDDNQWFRLTQI